MFRSMTLIAALALAACRKPVNEKNIHSSRSSLRHEAVGRAEAVAKAAGYEEVLHPNTSGKGRSG